MPIRFWKSGAHGAWSDSTNWVGNVAPPGTADIAAFVTTPGHDSVATGDATVGALVLTGTGASTVTFTGALTLLGHVPNAAGTMVPVPGLLVDEWRHVHVAAGGTISSNAAIEIGQHYGGTLSLDGGTILSQGLVRLGGDAGSHGSLVITQDGAMNIGYTGTGGVFQEGTLVVGDYGSGRITVDVTSPLFQNGIYVTTEIDLGLHAGGRGVIDIQAGGVNASSFVVGGGGAGLIIVGAGGLMAGGGYTVSSHGEIRMAGGTLTGFYGTVDAGGLIDGSGHIGTLGIINDGVIRATGTLFLDARLSGEGPDTIHGTGTLEIGANATLDTSNVFLSGQTVRFLAPTGTLVIPSGFEGSGWVKGFQTGDVIRLGGYLNHAAEPVTSIAFDAAKHVLSVYDGATRLDAVHVAGSFAGQHFALSQDAQGSLITLQQG